MPTIVNMNYIDKVCRSGMKEDYYHLINLINRKGFRFEGREIGKQKMEELLNYVHGYFSGLDKFKNSTPEEIENRARFIAAMGNRRKLLELENPDKKSGKKKNKKPGRGNKETKARCEKDQEKEAVTEVYKTLQELQILVADSIADAKKADRAFVTAGIRLRKRMKKVINLAGKVREAVIQTREEKHKQQNLSNPHNMERR